jgi:sugar/nucleoside kinase (ribokinase family)
VANDPLGHIVKAALLERGLWGDAVVEGSATPRSVVLYGPDGSRMVSTDLRDLPEAHYPPEQFRASIEGASWAVVTNIGFARPLLEVATAEGVPIAADVQAIDDLYDSHNAAWMAAAEVLFCSHERLPMPPAEWATAVQDTYGCRIVVVGMGADGALVKAGDDRAVHVPAVAPRGVLNTVGAGDALAAGFLQALLVTGDTYRAIEHAVTFAGWRVGAEARDDGYCSWDELVGLTQTAFAGADRPSSR